jgi:Na+/H+-translocating membrane pyrophosphatase
MAADEFGAPWSTLAFFVGAITSIICGYLGMKIATYANVRTTFMAITNDENDETVYEGAFKTAFRAGSVMGFLLTSIGLLFLYIMFLL